MSTTLYTVAPVTKFSAQGYDIVQAGTVVPDGVVWAIQTAAAGAGVTLNTSAGGAPQLVQVPSYYNGGTGAPVGDVLPVGAEVKDSTGAVYEKTPGGWAAAQSGAFAPIDTARLAPFPRARGAVCFTWDDGFSTHATVAALADARRQKHTFFVTSSLLNTNGYLTSGQLTAMSAAGHEIGAHGVNHVDMTAQTQTQRIIEYDNSKTAIEAIVGAGKVRSWAYPLGARSATTDRELYLRYDRVFGTFATNSPGIINPPPLYRADDRFGHFYLLRIQHDGTTAKHQAIVNALQVAASSPVIVVVYSHSLDSAQSMTTAQATALMDLAVTLGVPGVTTAEAFPAVPTLIDPGFEDATLASWSVIDSTSGSNLAESLADAPAGGYGGSRSLHLKSNASTGSIYALQWSHVPTPGVSWTLSGRYRVTGVGAGAGGVYARLTEADSFGTQLAQTTYSTTTTNSTWTSLSQAVTLNAATAFVRVDFLVNNLVADAYFDHVHFGPSKLGTFGQ